MSAARTPIAVQELVVAMDYGQFYLHTEESDPDDVLIALDEALDRGVAQRGGALVVISPHQNNFEMPLRVERWATEPPLDLDDWEVAYAAHLWSTTAA